MGKGGMGGTVVLWVSRVLSVPLKLLFRLPCSVLGTDRLSFMCDVVATGGQGRRDGGREGGGRKERTALVCVRVMCACPYTYW